MYTYKDFSHGCVPVGAARSWTCTSDQATKSDFTDIQPRDVLARLLEMPIAQWRWKGEAETVRHMNQTAQDFRAAFGLGYDDKAITLVDSEGVALVAIQGLNQIVQDEDAKIEAQQREILALKERMARFEALRDDVAKLKSALAAFQRSSEITAAR